MVAIAKPGFSCFATEQACSQSCGKVHMIVKTYVLHVGKILFSRQTKPVEGVQEVLGRRGDRGNCR